MTTKHSTGDHPARRASIRLLRQGIATPSEIATIADVSRQLVRYWIMVEQIDWRSARNDRLAKAYRTASGKR